MAKRKHRVLKIGGWTILGFVSLILLITMVFYLGREYFMGKALSYMNEQQPGEVQMEQMNLIPFLNFPDVTLQLREVKYYEKAVQKELNSQDPLLSLGEIHVTLDLLDLIRGGIMVSEARLKDGFVHMKVYADNISNLENALGIRFGEQGVEDKQVSESSFAIDLDKIELVNITASMDNQGQGQHFSAKVNRLESSFSYLEGLIRAAVEVDIDIDTLKYQTFNESIDKNIYLNGSINLDPEAHLVDVEPSSLRVSGLEFETWGSLDFKDIPRLDFAFVASNEGLELLNFLFRGVLNLDEIEQIGGGSIHLNGTMQGSLGEGNMPVVRMNGNVEELGFRIKALDKTVRGISFQMFASNGGKSDLSEGYLKLTGFQARFPEGMIKANLTASNLVEPELSIEVDAGIDLEGLEQMFNLGFMSDLSGSVALKGKLSGKVNRETGQFLNDEGKLSAFLNDVAFVIKQDSISYDSVSDVHGEIILHENTIGTENLAVKFNGNSFELGITSENILLYFLDYDTDLSAKIALSSELFSPAEIIGDTGISNILGEEIRAFYLCAGAKVEKEQLDSFLEWDSIPEAEIFIDSFGISLPMYADIYNLSASLGVGPDSLTLHHLGGSIGESTINMAGVLSNYNALVLADSGGVVALDFDFSSEMMHARDLLTFGEEFLLPETYSTEYLKDFILSGRVEAPAAGLVYDSVSMDFGLDIQNLGWSLRYYPSRFKDFLIEIKREGDLLLIDNIQGSVGENNLNLSASLENFADTLVENISGNIELYSDLLDFNHLLNYRQPIEENETNDPDTLERRAPLRLNELPYPNIDFIVDIGEIRYGKNTIYGMNGKFRSSKEKIFYLDRLITSPEGRGTLEFNGLLNVSDSTMYSISAELGLEGIDISDLNLELQSEDTTFLLKDNFQGLVDARGLAEIFITPDLKVDMPTSTAVFNVTVSDGALINFTPLQAAGKFLDSKDLNNVRFATVRNSFTLMDSKIIIPLMNVESTLGQLLITGEQGLDMSYLYLVYVPPKLAKAAARSALSEGSKEDGEDQVNQMKRGDFMMITVWSDGTVSDFKLGDKREKFQE
jgi:hypothetical protein